MALTGTCEQLRKANAARQEWDLVTVDLANQTVVAEAFSDQITTSGNYNAGVYLAAVPVRLGKALVIYGATHFYRTMPRDYPSSMGEDIGIARMLEVDYPGRTFVEIPVGGGLDLPPGHTRMFIPTIRSSTAL